MRHTPTVVVQLLAAVLLSHAAGAQESVDGCVVDGFEPGTKVLDDRAGSAREEAIRLQHMDEACDALALLTLVHTSQGDYLVHCDEPQFRDATNGFLPPGVNGYMRLEWGMSMSQARKHMPGLRDVEGVLVKEGKVERFAALTSLHFVNGKLKAVVLTMRKPIDAGLTMEARWSAIADAFARKYGDAHVEHDDVFPVAMWNNDTTVLVVKREIGLLHIAYSSRALSREVERVSVDEL